MTPKGRHIAVAALAVATLGVLVVAVLSVLARWNPVGRWTPVDPPVGMVQLAYTGRAIGVDTSFEVGPVVAGVDGTLFVNQNRASPGAGSDAPLPDGTDIVALRPDGTAGVVEEPVIEGLPSGEMRVLAAGADGGLYFWDGDNSRLVARNGQGTWSAVTAPHPEQNVHDGDGGLARHAHVADPVDAAVGSDGSLFVAEQYAVRRIGADGIITTVAGTDAFDRPEGQWGRGGGRPFGPPLPEQRDQAPATQTLLPDISGLATLADGSLALVFEKTIRIVGLDGIMTIVVGPGFGPQTEAARIIGAEGEYGTALGSPAVGPDQALYTLDGVRGRLLRWRPEEGLSLAVGDPLPLLGPERFVEEGPFDFEIAREEYERQYGEDGSTPVLAERVRLAGGDLAFLPNGDLAMSGGGRVVVAGEPAALPSR